jgi:hypothetical protein
MVVRHLVLFVHLEMSKKLNRLQMLLMNLHSDHYFHPHHLVIDAIRPLFDVYLHHDEMIVH